MPAVYAAIRCHWTAAARVPVTRRKAAPFCLPLFYAAQMHTVTALRLTCP